MVSELFAILFLSLSLSNSNSLRDDVSLLEANEITSRLITEGSSFSQMYFEYGKRPILIDGFDYCSTDVDNSSSIKESIAAPASLTADDGIYGSDDRTWLTDSQYSQNPYRMVAQLYYGRDTNNDGVADTDYMATGFLVGPNVLMTAAHVVYNASYGWVTNMTAYFGANGYPLGDTAVASASAIAYWCGNNATTGSENDDWAFVKLNWNVGNTYGYFNVVNMPISRGTSVRMIGYQGTTANMSVAYDQVRKTPGTYGFYHRIDAISGSSGAPIFYGTTNNVIGIHSGGHHVLFDDYNTACRISSYLEQYVSDLRTAWLIN